MSNICRFFYNLSSLLICFVICFVRSFVEYATKGKVFFMFVYALSIFFSAISWKLFLKFQRKVEIEKTPISSISAEQFDPCQYLITCFIPLLSEELFITIIINILYIALMLKKQVVYFNPLIWLMGYNVYTVTLVNGIENITFISKNTIIRKPERIIYSELYNGFLIDRSEVGYEEC